MLGRNFMAAAAAGFLALAGAGVVPAVAAEKVTFVMPHPSRIAVLPITAAVAEGYFEEAGLDVEFQAVNGSGAVLQALAAGQAQIGNPGAGPFIMALDKGMEATFIYRLNPNNSFGIMVPDEDGAADPQGLSGKVIGVGTADGAEVAFARSVMREAGLEDGTDYSMLVVGDGGQAVAAFLRGDVDAYVASTTDLAIITHRGIPLRNITPEKYRSFFGNGLAVMNSYLESNPETVAAFIEAVHKGAEFAADPANEQAMLDNIAKLSPQEAEDSGFAKALMGQINIRQTPIIADKPRGYQGAEEWEAWQQSLLASGELAAPLPDLSAIYTNRFVEPAQ